MKIGVNTWVWVSPLTNEHLEKLVPHVAELGFDWIEFPLEDTSLLDYKKAAEIVRQHNMGVSVCGAMSLDRDFIHPDPVIQQNAVDYTRECIDACAQLGATTLGGPFYSGVGRTWQQTPEEREKDMEILVGYLRSAAEYAAAHGVTICIEALNRFETSFINLTDQVIEVVERVDHPACQAMIDTFHLNIEEPRIGDAVRKLGKRLRHVHSNENDRGTPGTGHFPWQELAQALKDIRYDGALVIESFTPDVKSIARAAAIWRPLAPSPDFLAQEGCKFLKQITS